jgi:uncharacterized LabA/DUF88 family protein
MNRVSFLIDGFNLYHSVVALQKATKYKTKWLDIASLCSSYIHLFGKAAQLESIYYFSAIPHHLVHSNPDKIKRHEDYLDCLKHTGVLIELGRFKQKDVYCTNCQGMLLKHEEKETDVSIAIKLMEICFTNSCDTAVIVSGDTDLSPAVRRCQTLFSDKEVCFAFPYARKNRELQSLAPKSFRINQKKYIQHQLPNPIKLKDRREIYKPSTW